MSRDVPVRVCCYSNAEVWAATHHVVVADCWCCCQSSDQEDEMHLRWIVSLAQTLCLLSLNELIPGQLYSRYTHNIQVMGAPQGRGPYSQKFYCMSSVRLATISWLVLVNCRDHQSSIFTARYSAVRASRGIAI